MRADAGAWLPTGQIRLTSTAGGTLSPWSAAYSATLSSPELQFLGNTLTNLSTALRLDASGVHVDSLKTSVNGGQVEATGTLPSAPEDRIAVNISFNAIDLSALRAPIELPAMSGIVSGKGTVDVQQKQMADLNSLGIVLNGTGDRVTVADWGLGDVNYSVRKAVDSPTINLDLRDRSSGQRWQAQGVVQPDESNNWLYNITASGAKLDLSARQLIALISGDAPASVPFEILLVTGQLQFKGSTGTGLDETRFDFTELTTLTSNNVEFATGTLAGRTSQRLLAIDRAHIKIGPGTIDGAVKWHWQRPDRNDSDSDKLQLKIAGFDLASIKSWRLPSLESTFARVQSIEGQLNADINLERSAAQANGVLTGWMGALDLAIGDLVVRKQAIGSLSANGELTTNQWRGEVKGDVLSAPLRGNIELAVDRTSGFEFESVRGNVQWIGAEAGRLLGIWQPRKQASQWRGTLNLRSEFSAPLVTRTKTDVRSDSTTGASGFVEIEVPQLVYKNRTIVRELLASGRLENDTVRLTRFDGSVGGGRVDVSGAYELPTGRFFGLVVNLQRISLEEAIHLVDPDMAVDLQGRADMRVRVNIARGYDLHGSLRLRDTLFMGIPISEAHSDFELNADQPGSVIRIHAANVRGRAFGGRLNGDVRARLSSRTALEVRATVQRGEVEQLSEWSGTSSVVGRGKFDGVVEIAASDFRTSRDLQGRVDLDFEDTDARTLPIAGQLARFVPLFGLPSTEFERGRLVATISRGDLRMRSLALWGRQLSVIGSGNVGLVSGQLDLQLVVRVGGGLSQQIAANYLTQLAASAVPPVELVLQINRLVANRAIFLRVAGTTSQPVIQPQAGRIVEQALLRSLLEQAAPILSATIATPVANAD